MGDVAVQVYDSAATPDYDGEFHGSGDDPAAAAKPPPSGDNPDSFTYRTRQRVAYHKSKLWRLSFGGAMAWLFFAVVFLLIWFFSWVIGTIIAIFLGMSIIGIVAVPIVSGIIYVIGTVCAFCAVFCLIMALIFVGVALIRMCCCPKTIEVQSNSMYTA